MLNHIVDYIFPRTAIFPRPEDKGNKLVLFGATPLLGGEGAFTAAIVARIGVQNVLWLIGLVAASEIVRLLNRRYRTAS
jgi:hypothetical protein